MHNDQNPSFTHQCVVLSKKKMDLLLQYGSNFLHLKLKEFKCLCTIFLKTGMLNSKKGWTNSKKGCERIQMFMHYVFKKWNVEFKKTV